MENGFYKLDNGFLQFGQMVDTPTYFLIVSKKDDYIYPVDGWRYFDTLALARTFFNIPPDPLCPCP